MMIVESDVRQTAMLKMLLKPPGESYGRVE